MIPFPPLWADAEWIRWVVPLVMFSVYILNRLLGDSPAAKQQKARQQARVNPPPPADKQQVEDEVGEFLRRAAQQRTGKQPLAPANQPIQTAKPVRKPLAEAVHEAPSAMEVPQAAERPRRVAAADPIGPRRLVDRDARQGKEITKAEAAMQSHLQQTFGHQVGSLSNPAPGEVAAGTATVSSEVADMLRDPQSIRDAIVVSEILRRPIERW